MHSRFMFIAAIAGFTGVALGAFGAHGLKNILSEHLLDVYKTAVNYQMYHALTLGLVATQPQNRILKWAGYALITGIVLFSGSLYVLAISNISWLGIITPFGGVAFLTGWALLAYHALQNSSH